MVKKCTVVMMNDKLCMLIFQTVIILIKYTTLKSQIKKRPLKKESVNYCIILNISIKGKQQDVYI